MMKISTQVSMFSSLFREKTGVSKQPRRNRFGRLFMEQMEDRRLLATIDLAALTPSQGTTIFGAEVNDYSGFSVSNAGDVNGDGFDDLFIGAYSADASGNAKSLAGDSYLIFGGPSLPATIDLANLGSAGVTIFGVEANDRSGRTVSKQHLRSKQRVETRLCDWEPI